MDFIELIGRLWASLSGQLGGDGLTLLIVAILAIVLTIGWRIHSAIVQTEFYKKNKALWELVDDKVADTIFLIAVGDVDLTVFEQRVVERANLGLSYVDPRMLYLIDKVQQQVKDRFGVSLNFEELLGRAERIYDEVKNDPTTSVGGEPVSDPTFE